MIDARGSAGPFLERGGGGLDGLVWRRTRQEEGLDLYLDVLDRSTVLVG